MVNTVIIKLIRSRQQEKLNKVIEGLLPEMAPSSAAFLQARMQADAKAQILNSGDYVRATEIARLAGYSENNPSAQPSKWKREQAIFVIEHNGADYFPLYGLNPEKSYKPSPARSEILTVFHGVRSSWSIAFWFAGLNSFLTTGVHKACWPATRRWSSPRREMRWRASSMAKRASLLEPAESLQGRAWLSL